MKRTVDYSERIILDFEESKGIIRDYLKARGEWKCNLDIHHIHAETAGLYVTLVPLNPEEKQP